MVNEVNLEDQLSANQIVSIYYQITSVTSMIEVMRQQIDNFNSNSLEKISNAEHFIYKKFRTIDGIGFGDFILLASLGALYGVYSIPFILFFGSLFSLVIYLFKEKNKENYVPFGSGLILGAFLIFFLIEIELLTFV